MRPHRVSGDTDGARVLVFSGRTHTVVVAVAPRSRSAALQLQLPWIGSATATVSRTSAHLDAAARPPLSVTGGVLAAALPKASVSTYVLPN